MKKTLLLVFIHGFQGDDDTFGAFPLYLQGLIAHSLPKVRIAAQVFPKYETRGDLQLAVGKLQSWLQDLVMGMERERPTRVRTVFVCHSMGGIVAAEALLAISNESTGKGEMYPYIQGILAFDTPYLGLAPQMFAHSTDTHIKSASAALQTVSSLASWWAGTGTGSMENPPPASPKGPPSRSNSGVGLIEPASPREKGRREKDRDKKDRKDRDRDRDIDRDKGRDRDRDRDRRDKDKDRDKDKERRKSHSHRPSISRSESSSSHRKSSTSSKDAAAAAATAQASTSTPPPPSRSNSTPVTNPAPPSTSSAPTSLWGSLGKIALYAGAAGALAAAGGAAYMKREEIGAGFGWVSSHFEFVGVLMKGESLKARLRATTSVHGVGFANMYTSLGDRSRGVQAPGGFAATAQFLSAERTFCSVPGGVGGRDSEGREVKAEGKPGGGGWRGTWRKQVNEKAKDEIEAHTGMFAASTNPGYYGMCQEARDLIVEWVEAGWLKS